MEPSLHGIPSGGKSRLHFEVREPLKNKKKTKKKKIAKKKRQQKERRKLGVTRVEDVHAHARTKREVKIKGSGDGNSINACAKISYLGSFLSCFGDFPQHQKNMKSILNSSRLRFFIRWTIRCQRTVHCSNCQPNTQSTGLSSVFCEGTRANCHMQTLYVPHGRNNWYIIVYI